MSNKVVWRIFNFYKIESKSLAATTLAVIILRFVTVNAKAYIEYDVLQLTVRTSYEKSPT